MCVCVFNQTVKAGKKLILGWSCDSNIKHMGEKRNQKKKKKQTCETRGYLSQRGLSFRVGVH